MSQISTPTISWKKCLLKALSITHFMLGQSRIWACLFFISISMEKPTGQILARSTSVKNRWRFTGPKIPSKNSSNHTSRNSFHKYSRIYFSEEENVRLTPPPSFLAIWEEISIRWLSKQLCLAFPVFKFKFPTKFALSFFNNPSCWKSSREG